MTEGTAREQVVTEEVSANEETQQENNTVMYLDWEPRPFDAFAKVSRINSKELAIMIREQYQQNFFDCIGCFIKYTVNGRFDTTLFFQDRKGEPGENQIKNLVNVANGQVIKTNNLYDRMSAVNKRMLGKTYELTDETKVLLSDVMYGGKNPSKKRNWNDYVSERAQPASPILFQNNASQIIVAVTGLDLNLLCRKLFGSRMITETVREGNKIVNKTSDAKYQCSLSKTLSDGSCMINIEQIDPVKVDQIARSENPAYVQQQGGILMY